MKKISAQISTFSWARRGSARAQAQVPQDWAKGRGRYRGGHSRACAQLSFSRQDRPPPFLPLCLPSSSPHPGATAPPPPGIRRILPTAQQRSVDGCKGLGISARLKFPGVLAQRRRKTFKAVRSVLFVRGIFLSPRSCLFSVVFRFIVPSCGGGQVGRRKWPKSAASTPVVK